MDIFPNMKGNRRFTIRIHYIYQRFNLWTKISDNRTIKAKIPYSGVPSSIPPPGGTQSRLAWLGRGGQPKAKVAVATWLPLWEPDRGDTNPRLASVQIGGGHSGLGGDT